MSEVKHTPGPWEWYDFGDDWCLVSRTPRVPVVLAGNDHGRITTRDERGILQPITKDHPNAKLIAAAPELLDALRLIADIADGSTTPNSLNHIAKLARAAIAKAEGA